MGTHPIFESDFDCLTELKLLKMGKNNGKRKINYKQVYGGTDSQDIKRCKYSGNSVDPSDKTHGFLMSYRRKCLKQCHREAFSIAKFFTNQVYPDLIDANGDRVVNSALVSEENVEVDIEKQLLAESEASKEDRNDRVFHIYETGVSQSLFMDVRHMDVKAKEILNNMWGTILADKIPENFRVPSHLERLLPIQKVCVATKEIMIEAIKDVIAKEMPADVKDYHVMTRARFHSSLDSQEVKTIVIGVVKEVRPEMNLDWKKFDDVIFVEVLKKNCYIGIFKDWLPRQKYNWQEFHKRKTEKAKEAAKDTEEKEYKSEIRTGEKSDDVSDEEEEEEEIVKIKVDLSEEIIKKPEQLEPENL